MADKVTQVLLDVLKHALTESGEHRLFRSGKLDGLFPIRTALNNEASDLALRDGLLEVVRTETKGKTTTQWVRSTPKAVEFIHHHESLCRRCRVAGCAAGFAQRPAALARRHSSWLINLSDELIGEVQNGRSV